MKKTLYVLQGLLVVFFIYNLFNQKKKYTYIKPNNDYYVYDSNHYLLSSSKYLIYANSKELYNSTKNIEDKGGTQIVILALSDTTQYDANVIFNEWKIGKNGMGLLLIYYFNNDDELTGYEYLAGEQMRVHFTAAHYETLVNEYLYKYSSTDLSIAHLYYEILNFLYVNIYDYESFTYDINNYEDIMYESYYSYLPSSIQSYDFLEIPLWLNILILISFGGLFTTGIIYTNKGAGGKSSGYRYRK